jgi:hypothetical protein
MTLAHGLCALGVIAALSLVSVSAKADCGTTSCWDGCSNSFIQVDGDSCSSSFNGQQGCFTAIGECSGGGGAPPPVCAGTSCWDPCSGTFEFFSGANTCDQSFNGAMGCFTATASCQ